MVEKIKRILPNSIIEKHGDNAFIIFTSHELTTEQLNQFNNVGLRVQEALSNYEGANLLYKPCYIVSDKTMPEVKS